MRPLPFLHRPWIRRLSTQPSDPPVILRPYQNHCLETCLEAINSGYTRLGVSLPTGSGKTTVFISLLSHISPPKTNPNARKSLIIVNSVELARQSASQVANLFPSWSVEIEQGTKHKATGNADVTVATYQTLLSADRLNKFNPHCLKAVVVDEAHHAAAPSYRSILSRFDSNIKNPDSTFEPSETPHRIPIIGFSATFGRHDGLALGSVFERIVYHRDFLEMIKESWLCPVRFTTVKASINLKDVSVNSRSGDFNAKSLAHVINTDTINDLVVKTWLDRAAERKSTLVFCVNIAHVIALTQTFRRYGVDARYVYSGTPIQERKALVTSFRAGQFPVLINCAILTEGADIPNIDCVVLARPTRSRNVFAQMIGRGMRLSPSTRKQDCRIIDFVDSSASVSGVVCTPTLFGLEPGEFDIDDESLEALERRAAKIKNLDLDLRSSDTPEVPQPQSVTYIDHEDPFSMVDESSGAPHVATMSKYSWVGCGNGIYVLDCMGKGFIRIDPVEGQQDDAHFEAHFTSVIFDKATAADQRVSPYRSRRKILTATTLNDAIRGCDTYVTNKVIKGPLILGLFRSAKWRRCPATDGQKDFIRKRWSKTSSESNSNKAGQIDNMTKGEASNIIVRLKHGAQARFHSKEKVLTKVAAATMKERVRREREQVRVGPLSPV